MATLIFYEICPSFRYILTATGQVPIPLHCMSRIRLLKCMFDPNLKVVTSIGGDLLQGQTQNKVSFDFKFILTLQVKVNQSTKQHES